MGRTVICIAILVAVMILGELLGGPNSKGAGLAVLFLFLPLLLAVFVFLFGKGFRYRISSGVTIICSIVLFVYMSKTTANTFGGAFLLILYPLICAVLCAVLFVVEWVTRFFKDRGFRGWWSVPLAFFVLLLVCVCYPVVVRHALVFLSKDAKIGITFHVVDSEGRDVPHASVRAAFHTGVFLGISDVTEKAGETDAGGTFFVKQKTHQVSYSVEKEGYYMTQAVLRARRGRRHDIAFVELKPGNQTLKIVLKEKRSPAALYVKTLLLRFPQSGVPYGFDCTIGDLVEPDGTGKITDLIFTYTGEKRGVLNCNYELCVQTVNGGGLIRGSQDKWSVLKSPHTAPESGYVPEVVFWFNRPQDKVRGDSMLGDDEYLLFETYSRGGQSCVRKIYGSMTLGADHDNPSGGGSRFLYFFNPVPGDRRIESDPDKNLFGKQTMNILLQP